MSCGCNKMSLDMCVSETVSISIVSWYCVVVLVPPGLVFSMILDSMPSYASSQRRALKQGYVADLIR